MEILPCPTPVEEVESVIGGPVFCASCSEQLLEDAYFDNDEELYYCEKCMQRVIEKLKSEAKAFAKSNCKITSPLPEYDADDEFRCTPEEYERGDKESYTPSAYFCGCRHNCTNYDSLIKEVSREGTSDQVFYDAIRRRIDFLLVEAIEREQPDAVEDWFLDEWYFQEKSE